MSLFDSIQKVKDKVFSLDIETTGRDSFRDKVWSIGVSNQGNATEKFFQLDETPRRFSPSEIEQVRQTLTSSDFGKKTYQGGALSDYFNALSSGKAYTPGQIADVLSNSFSDNSVILIQNAHFENKFLSKYLTDSPHKESFRDTMAYRGGGQNSKYFYTPPEVTNARAYAAQAFDAYAHTGMSEYFDVTRDMYRQVMRHYEDAINAKEGNVVVDLMDITKSLFAEAADKGLINKRDIHIGTGVEFLAKHFLGEQETHLAKDDALQQEKLFQRFLPMYDELRSGNISDETRAVFNRVAEAHPKARSVQMLKAIRSAIEESQGTDQYKMLDRTAFHIREIGNAVNKSGQEFPVFAFTQNPNTVIKTDNPLAAAQHAMNRYKGIYTEGIDRRALFGRLQGLGTAAEQISLLNDMTVALESGATAPAEELGARTTYVVDRASEYIGKAKTWWRELPTINKFAYGAVAAIAGLSLLADNEDSDKQIRQIKLKKELEERRYSTENNIRLYTNIPNYHGSGFANWNERNKSHEY